MSAQSDEAMRLLREIHAMIHEMRGGDQRTAPRDSIRVDLDNAHGDPVVRQKSPKDWTGADMTGKRFSECPAEYLDLVAARLDYFAGRETDEKKRRYNELDAARARGWAGRIRAGHTHPAVPATGAWGAEEMPKW